MVTVHSLTGPDLAYWVSRANNPSDPNVVRRHYGTQNCNDPAVEPSMRQFVEAKFGNVLPDAKTWA